MIYSEYEQYDAAFADRLRRPEGLAPEDCRCHGGGWILSDTDIWYACPDHHKLGQAHPEDVEYEAGLEEDSLAMAAGLAEVPAYRTWEAIPLPSHVPHFEEEDIPF